MRSGRLRHRLELQRPTTATGGDAGQPSIAYETMDAVWGAIEPITGKERYIAGKVQGETTHTVRIRRYAAIRDNWRIKFGTRHFDIVGVIRPDERAIEVVIAVVEVDAP